MPPTPPTFTAKCEACGKVATFREGRKDRRRPDFTTETVWYFECGACRQREEKVMDEDGVVHKWTGNRHTTFRPG